MALHPDRQVATTQRDATHVELGIGRTQLQRGTELWLEDDTIRSNTRVELHSNARQRAGPRQAQVAHDRNQQLLERTK